ncbi:MAG: hypothetical protein BGO69_13885 [Bacteroidetes bacterium 46-16]|nr:MAG: hypothetical protein BGO69_13885 [Bacteroidetes bacterium 46-16]
MQFSSYWQILLVLTLRYLIIAGLGWMIWYRFIRNRVLYKKIQLRFPASKDYAREISYSLLTVFIFAAVPALMLLTPFRQYTQYYRDIDAHSRLWFWLAFPIMFLLHDAYFYFAHRFMHHPKVFRAFHLVHHKSTNPSPFAAFAFHPLEALVEAGIFAVFVMVMPLHPWHLFVFFFVMIVYNVYGHLGWELYPKGFSKHPIGKWINTSMSHNQHHQYFTGNYGLYFLWWDRWFGTLREDYDAKYEEVMTRPQPDPLQRRGG